MQLWKGRFKKELSKTTNDFNSSISFDSRMYKRGYRGQYCPRNNARQMRHYQTGRG